MERFFLASPLPHLPAPLGTKWEREGSLLVMIPEPHGAVFLGESPQLVQGRVCLSHEPHGSQKAEGRLGVGSTRRLTSSDRFRGPDGARVPASILVVTFCFGCVRLKDADIGSPRHVTLCFLDIFSFILNFGRCLKFFSY